MTALLKGVGALTLFVDDLDATKPFYAEVLGLAPVFEDADSAAYSLGGLVVNLLRADAAGELVEPVAVGGPGLGARFQPTIEVDDVQEVCDLLVERGGTLNNGPLDRPWGIRTATLVDPAGHVWEIAGPIPDQVTA